VCRSLRSLRQIVHRAEIALLISGVSPIEHRYLAHSNTSIVTFVIRSARAYARRNGQITNWPKPYGISASSSRGAAVCAGALRIYAAQSSSLTCTTDNGENKFGFAFSFSIENILLYGIVTAFENFSLRPFICSADRCGFISAENRFKPSQGVADARTITSPHRNVERSARDDTTCSRIGSSPLW
jgi:hypothetical protein